MRYITRKGGNLLKYVSVCRSFMLLVDDRENPKVVNKLLMRMGKEKVKVCRLQAADYILGSWGVEAKEINDLYRSIMGFGRTRTIVAQLRDLQEEFDNPMLVVYGTELKPYIPGGRPNARQVAMEMARMRKVIQQFKTTFYQRFPKIRYMELTTMDDFTDWLVVNHTQQGMQLSKHSPHLHKSVKNAELDPRVAVLSTVRGITPDMAKDLLEKFGSIPKILRTRTTQKEIMSVPGIGRKRAKDILKLRENY